MPRFAPFLLFLCLPLTAAEIVTTELPVADLRLVANANTSCGVVSGATRAYAICNDVLSGPAVRFDLEADGKPILPTRVPFAIAGGAPVVAGDALFYTQVTETSISVRRFGSDAEARIDAVASRPVLISNRGSLLLLTYTSGGTMMGAIVDTDLRIAVRPFAILPAGAWISAASAAATFMIVSHDSAGASTGVIVDSGGAVHAISLPTPLASFDTLASNGSEYLYVWQRDQTPLAAQRYSTSGEAVGGLEVVAANSHGLPAAVWTGSDYLIAWTDDADAAWMRTLGGAPQPVGNGFPTLSIGPAGLFVTTWGYGVPQTIRRLDTNGAEHVLAYGPLWQLTPAIAMDGLEAAVIWREGNEQRIGRIGVDGSRLDRAGVVLPAGNKYPVIAFDGVNYLAVWMSSPHVYGLFFGRDGRVAGEPFVIGDEIHDSQLPAVTWSGTHYLVTWQGGLTSQGTGAIVTTSGAATPFTFGGPSGYSSSISAGPRTLVVYGDTSEPYFTKLTGVFLDAAGTTFDVARDPQTGGINLAVPRVVSNGRDYLVTWLRFFEPSKSEAWMARFDAKGRRIGEPFLAASSTVSTNAVHAIPLFDGTGYRVVVSGNADVPLFIAKVDDAVFACDCFEERSIIPIDFDVPAHGRFIDAAASGDAIAIAYERWALHEVPRLVVRFVRTPPEPRHRATR